MRRRLFWTIAGVAAVSGLLVLAGAVLASQRAAVEATYREMNQSAEEAVALIRDSVDRLEQRPAAAAELLRLIEGQQIGPILGRIRRTAGGSDLVIGVLSTDGSRLPRGLFDRVSLDQEALTSGRTLFLRSIDGELVVVKPAPVAVRDVEATLVVALARDAPVLRIGDQFRGLVLIVIGIGVIAALLARLLSGQITRKLAPLADASRRIAGGDLTVRVPDLGDSELDEVASSFNFMATELEGARTRERDFLLGVGHDLRTPLTTIGGYAEALESGQIDAGELPRIGGVLYAQTRQLTRLIEDLTTLARVEQPEFSLRIETVDLAAHVSEVVEGFGRRAEEVGVNLVNETKESVVVDTDPDRIGQIAQNLVENALRFTPETGSVTVRVGQDEGGAVLEVSDSGVGIDPDDLPHVFDRHFMGRQRIVRKEGSGLGLHIVKLLAEKMGGDVVVTSQVGRGTSVRVRLPKTRPS